MNIILTFVFGVVVVTVVLGIATNLLTRPVESGLRRVRARYRARRHTSLSHDVERVRRPQPTEQWANEWALHQKGETFWWPGAVNSVDLWWGTYFLFWDGHNADLDPSELKLRSVGPALGPGDIRGEIWAKASALPSRDHGAALVSVENLDILPKSHHVDYRLLSFEAMNAIRAEGLNFLEQAGLRDGVSDWGNRVSVYGLRRFAPYPAGLAVHCIVLTKDRFIILGKRSKDRVDFHRGTWSASLEETVSLGRGDDTLAATAERGVFEELGIERGQIKYMRCLAIGREHVDVDADGARLSSRGTSAVILVQLNVDCRAIEDARSKRGQAVDKFEHDAMLGVRAKTAADVDGLLDGSIASTAIQKASEDPGRCRVFGETQLLELGVADWHPTSTLRLWLTARWLNRCEKR